MRNRRSRAPATALRKTVAIKAEAYRAGDRVSSIILEKMLGGANHLEAAADEFLVSMPNDDSLRNTLEAVGRGESVGPIVNAIVSDMLNDSSGSTVTMMKVSCTDVAATLRARDGDRCRLLAKYVEVIVGYAIATTKGVVVPLNEPVPQALRAWLERHEVTVAYSRDPMITLVEVIADFAERHRVDVGGVVTDVLLEIGSGLETRRAEWAQFPQPARDEYRKVTLRMLAHANVRERPDLASAFAEIWKRITDEDLVS